MQIPRFHWQDGSFYLIEDRTFFFNIFQFQTLSFQIFYLENKFIFNCIFLECHVEFVEYKWLKNSKCEFFRRL